MVAEDVKRAVMASAFMYDAIVSWYVKNRLKICASNLKFERMVD